MGEEIKKEKIEDKIARLEIFCTNNQKLWFNRRNDEEVQRQLDEIQDEAEREKKAEELKKAKLDYDYIRIRKSKGKLKPEYIERMKNARVGGVFGAQNDDKYICDKYGISSESLLKIIESYGSLDNFKKIYVQAIIDGNTQKVIPKGLESKLVNCFDISDSDLINRKGSYFTCLSKIYRDRNHNQNLSDIEFIDGSKIEKLINEEIYHTVYPRYARIFRLKYGLDCERKSTREIAEEYDTSSRNVNKIIGKSSRRIGRDILRAEYYKKLQDDNTISKYKRKQFIIRYFESHSIFYSQNENELDKEARDELLEIYKDGKTILTQIHNIYNNSKSPLEIELFIRRIENEERIDCSGVDGDSKEKLEYLMSNSKEVYNKYVQILEQMEYIKSITTEQKVAFIIKYIGETVNVRDFFWNCSSSVIQQMVQSFRKSFGTEEVEIGKFSDYYISPEYLNNIIYKNLIQRDMTQAVKNMQEKPIEEVPKEHIETSKQEKTSLTELHLDARASNALEKAGFKYIEDLVTIEEEELKRIRNIGAKTLDEIVNKVHSLGYEFKEKDEDSVQEENVEGKTNISELHLDTRAYNALEKAGFKYIEDLVTIEEEELKRIRNLGDKTLNEILNKVHAIGYKFKWEEGQQENSDNKIDEVLKAYIELLEDAYTRLNKANKQYSDLRVKVGNKQSKPVKDNREFEEEGEEGEELE